jgi:hypothetical protein
MTVQPDADLKERLRFLCRITLDEVELLTTTTHRLFPQKERVTADVLIQWIADTTMSERLDAFVTRYRQAVARLAELSGRRARSCFG